MPFYPRKAKKAKRSYRRKNVTKKAKPSKSLTKMVQQIIHKDAETKQAFTTLAPTYFNSGISVIGDMLQIFPSINNSTADNGRIGDQIRAQSLVIKGALQISGASSSYSNSRVAVRLFVVQPKNLGDYTNITFSNTWLSSLLRKGGVTTAFTGVMSDLWAPVNTDHITKYYDKVFYLDSAYVSVAGTSTTGNSVKFFNIPMKMKNKLIRYDTALNSGLTPVNYNPIMLCGYVHMDGSSPDTVTTAVSCQFDSILNYEDV